MHWPCFEPLHFTAPKEILHKINGKFPGGQLTAIMGPSGAGKSTLLDVLSGYRRTGVTGSVYVNGRIRSLDSFRKMSCYITQEDRIQTLLTVLENMRIAADFKLGNTFKPYEKEARVSPPSHSSMNDMVLIFDFFPFSDWRNPDVARTVRSSTDPCEAIVWRPKEATLDRTGTNK